MSSKQSPGPGQRGDAYRPTRRALPFRPRVLGALLATAAILPTTARAADIPGDRTTRAVLRPGPAGVEGVFERRGDSDWYRVTLRGGQNYAFEFYADQCVAFRLRSLKGAVLRSASAGGTNDGGFEIRPARTTTYFAEFVTCPPFFFYSRPFPSRYTGEVRADARGDRTTAATIRVGQTITGRLNWGLDSDFFRTTLQAGTSYTATAAGNTGEYFFKLLTSDGMTIFNEYGFFDIQKTFTVPTSGTYYLVVDSADDNGGDYTLRLTTP
jgi:hypothetical protein